MIPISVCIITKNEAAKLEKSLKALRPYPFEIVVADTGSTDNSMEIAAKYADKVVTFEWVNDFSAARNYCASKASHNVILSMDTDEYITELDLDSFFSLIEANPKGVGEILRIDYFTADNGSLSAQETWITRLYNRKYYTYERAIHECIVPRKNINFEHYHLPVKADHDGYLGTKDALEQKSLRNIELLEKDLKNNPGDPYINFQIGQSYLVMRDEKTAIEYFRTALANDPSTANDYTRILVKNYGEILLSAGLLDEAQNILHYYDVYQNNADYLCLVGRFYILRNEFLKALPELIKALTAPEYDTPEAKKALPSYYIGHIYQYYGQVDIAIQHFQNCGDYPPALERLKLLGVN